MQNICMPINHHCLLISISLINKNRLIDVDLFSWLQGDVQWKPAITKCHGTKKKGSLLRVLRYSEDPVTTNYLVNSKNIRDSGVAKLNQGEQWDIHLVKQSTDLRVNSYI